MQQLEREFQDLHQTIETVAKINAKFQERALLVPQYAADEEMKKTRYHDMLRDDIREFVIFSGCKTLKSVRARRSGPRLLVRDREANRAEAVVPSMGGLTRGAVVRRGGVASVVVRLDILAGMIFEGQFRCDFTTIGWAIRRPTVKG